MSGESLADWPAPAPGAAPMAKMIMAQAGLETRTLLRNGEQLLLTWSPWSRWAVPGSTSWSPG